MRRQCEMEFSEQRKEEGPDLIFDEESRRDLVDVKKDFWRPLWTQSSLRERIEALSARLNDIYVFAASRFSDSDTESDAFGDPFESLLSRMEAVSYGLKVWLNDLSATPWIKGKDSGTKALSVDCLDVLESKRLSPFLPIFEVVSQLEISSLALAYELQEEDNTFEALGSRLERVNESLQKLKLLKSGVITAVSNGITDDELLDSNHIYSQMPKKKLRMVTFDGGGIRSYTSILILKALMEEFNILEEEQREIDEFEEGVARPTEKSELRSIPLYQTLPRDLFDYILGSSSGGLLAIMFGRLQLGPRQCEAAFQEFGHDFMKQQNQMDLRNFSLPTEARQKRFKNVVRQMINEYDPTPVDLRWGRYMLCSSWARCKTGVVAHYKSQSGISAQVLRSYDSNTTPGSSPATLKPADTCQIWDAALATCVKKNYLPSVKVNDQIFTDGGLATKSSTLEALKELTDNHGKDLEGSVVVSIGCGSRSESRRRLSLRDELGVKLLSRPYRRDLDSAIALASNADSVDEKVSNECVKRGIKYFRFDVDLDLDEFQFNEWEYHTESGKLVYDTLEDLEIQTEKYLETHRASLKACARALFDSQQDEADFGLNAKSRRAKSHPVRITQCNPETVDKLVLIPFARDHRFVAREHILESIEDFVNKGWHTALALYGLGGTGKTQIAIEYAYRFSTERPWCHVFWISMQSPATIKDSFRRIASRLFDSQVIDNFDDDLIEAVCNWLGTACQTTTLLVLDGLDDATFLSAEPSGAHLRRLLRCSQFLDSGSVLITSQDRETALKAVGDYNKAIEVNPLTIPESTSLLASRMSTMENADAEQLVEELGCMPLAITQAGDLLEERKDLMTIKDYIDLFHEESKATMPYTRSSLQNPVFSRLHTTLNHIQKTEQDASTLISTLSMFHHENVPIWILGDCDTHAIHDALTTLRNFSLVTFQKADLGNLVNQPKFVQTAVRAWLTSDTRDQVRQESLKAVERYFVEVTTFNHKDCKLLLPHAQEITRNKFVDHCFEVRRATLIAKIADFLNWEGSYTLALELNKTAAQIFQDSGIESSPETISNDLLRSQLYNSTGHLLDAEKLLIEVRNSTIASFSPEDPFRQQIELKVAAQDFANHFQIDSIGIAQKQLQAVEKRFEYDHVQVIRALADLGEAYKLKDNLEKARKTYEEVCRTYHKAVDCHDFDTLRYEMHLANVYQRMARFEEAQQLFEHALETYLALLGKTHPFTLKCKVELASLYTSKGQYEQAVDMYKQGLDGYLQLFGRNHVDTLTCQTELAGVYVFMYKFAEAKELYGPALYGFESTLGGNHRCTRNCYAQFWSVQALETRSLSHAEHLYETICDTYEDILGVEHPLTRSYQRNLDTTRAMLRGQGSSTPSH